jgi:PadR family transcriptional regulator, regulatory protein PadR
MGKGEYLGEFEQITLLALVRLDDNAYGMTIRREIEERTQRAVSIGAVYATLDRLEKKGYVRSWTADPTAERGGRSKRYFRIERAGVEAVQRAREILDSLWEGVEARRGRLRLV